MRTIEKWLKFSTMSIIMLFCGITAFPQKAVSKPATASIKFNKIDSLTFYRLKAKSKPDVTTVQKITDWKKANQLMKGIASWTKLYNDGDVYILKSIQFRNGKKLLTKEYDELSFVAYFPQEDVLLLEGGHTTDFSYNLTTGESTDDVGNMDVVTSPSGEYRLNSVFHGQECSTYFIQRKEKPHYYKKIFEVNSRLNKVAGSDVCYFEHAFWSDERTLNLYYISYESDVPKHHYYQLLLIGTL